jgi:hypothetical protein
MQFSHSPPSLFAGVNASDACELPKCGVPMQTFQGTLLERTGNENMRSAFEETSEMILRDISDMFRLI